LCKPDALCVLCVLCGKRPILTRAKDSTVALMPWNSLYGRDDELYYHIRYFVLAHARRL